MKYIYTLILFVCIVVAPATGQEDAGKTVYQVGDTLYTAVDRLPANPRLIHSNLEDYWDFTGLMAPFVHEIYVRPPAMHHGKPLRSAHCVISYGDGVDYDITVDGTDMLISGISLKTDNSVIVMTCEPALPLRVGVEDIGEGSSIEGVIDINLPIEFVAALEDTDLSLADSVRLLVSWKYELLSDQKGQMQLESGHYDVIRQYLTKTISVQTEVKQGGQWSVTNKKVPVTLPEELVSGTTYSFWSDRYPEPVAVVRLDESENAESVLFKARKYSGRRIVQSSPSQADIFVHPNPSFGMVRFDLVNLPSGMYQIEIYNILGVRLRSYSLEVDGSTSYPLNLSDLKKGTYIYRLVDSFHKTLRSKRIVIITP